MKICFLVGTFFPCKQKSSHGNCIFERLHPLHFLGGKFKPFICRVKVNLYTSEFSLAAMCAVNEEIFAYFMLANFSRKILACENLKKNIHFTVVEFQIMNFETTRKVQVWDFAKLHHSPPLACAKMTTFTVIKQKSDLPSLE